MLIKRPQIQVTRLRPSLRSAVLFALVHRGNPNPNPFLYQTRTQRQRVAAEKEKQGRRSMWRCLCRHMTLRPCFDVVRLAGLEPARISVREPKSRMSTNSITGADNVNEQTLLHQQ